MKSPTITLLSPEEEALLQQMADVLKNAPKGLENDALLDVWRMQTTSMHLLAQQVAFFSVKEPTTKNREAYLKMTMQKFSVLIRHYENQIKRAPRGKAKQHEPASEAVHQ